MSSTVRRSLYCAFWSVPIGVAFSDCIASVVKVQGNSMSDTLRDSDLILVEKLSYRLDWLYHGIVRYRRGDVVTLWAPDEPFQLLTKRLIALEGDLVLNEVDGQPVTVEPGRIWVEGDNRGKNESRDSSSAYGPVHMGLMHGRAVAVLWPISRIKMIKNEFSPLGKVKVASDSEINYR